MISCDAAISVTTTESDPLLASIRPFIGEVADCVKYGFDLGQSIEIANQHHAGSVENFQINGDLSLFGLKRELLFPKTDRINRFAFRNDRIGQTLVLNDLTEKEVLEVGNTLRLASTTESYRNLARIAPYPDLMEALRELGIFVEETPETVWKIPEGCPGIFRLQHASFLLQSTKARVLVDPHFVSAYSSSLQARSRMLPHNFHSLLINAVVITHSHEDHYDVPSLMTMPRDTFFIVPPVPEQSLLAPKMGTELRSFGFQNVIEADWYSDCISVEDIEIWPLPFYGEQPLRYEQPREKGLRNWGCSFVFRTPDFTAWCLIDSGADADGSMVEVAHQVKKRFGAIDVVLSNLHEFYVGVGRGYPFYTTGKGQYWLSLTADQIRRFPAMANDRITLGPKGVAEICAIVEAKTFLPYAHLWEEAGAIPYDEPQLLAKLVAQPALTNSRILIQNWRIGDVWQPRNQS